MDVRTETKMMDSSVIQNYSGIETTIGTGVTVLGGLGIGLVMQKNMGNINELFNYGKIGFGLTANVVKSSLRDIYCLSRGESSNKVIKEDLGNAALFNLSIVVGYGLGVVSDFTQSFIEKYS